MAVGTLSSRVVRVCRKLLHQLGKQRQWQEALSLLAQMWKLVVEPITITCRDVASTKLLH